MRVAIVFSLVVATALAVPVDNEPLLKNSIEKLIRETIEYFRFLLQRHDPYVPPAFPEEHIQTEDVDLKATVSNLKVNGETEFTIDNIYFNLPQLKSTFQVTEPNAHIEGNYQISGTAFNKEISGSGALSFDLTGGVLKGEIKYTIDNHNLTIKDLNLDYEVSGIQATAEGLQIEGLTPDEVKDFLSNGLLQFSTEHKELLCQIIGDRIKELANQFLIGKTLNFMKSLIASTPDPPPFHFFGGSYVM